MSRARGPRLKKIRRFQTVLPGLTAKSSERKPYPPGQHGPGRRGKLSDYRIRLEEKQKIRFNYGISERQLRRYYRHATKTKGDTGVLLLQLLESRLDNAVFRAGFAPTLAAARQLVTHGHFLINDRRVDIPSYAMTIGDKVVLKESSRKIPMVESSLAARALELPSYLSVDNATFSCEYLAMPTREDIPVEVQEQLIIEFYSRVA